MSDVIQQPIRCPRCNAESSFAVWQSLNATLNPAEKESLMSGELLRFTCPGCGAATPVVYPMLYHDMERRLMLWMIPDREDGAQATPDAADVPGAGEAAGGVVPGYTARVVSSPNELMEKILIFEAGLDDIALEMFKVVINLQLEAAGVPTGAKVFFARTDHDAAGVEHIVFAVLTPDGATRSASLPREPNYANMEMAAAELASRHPPPGKWPRIDAAYLSRLMTVDTGERHGGGNAGGGNAGGGNAGGGNAGGNGGTPT